MIDFRMLLNQVVASRGWPMVFSPQGGARIEVPTEPGRTQVVELTQGADPDGRPLAFIWSRVTTINLVGDPWYLLKLNADLPYGGLAVRGNEVLMVETQLMETADPEELTRAIFYVARYADNLEKQAHGGADRN